MPAKDYTKWHLPKGAKLRLGKGYINEIAYSPDSSRLAVASSIGIWIYNAETGEELDLFTGHTGPVERFLWDYDNNVSNFVYSPDGSTIAIKPDHEICLSDAVTGERKGTITGESPGLFVYSPDGSTIATVNSKEVCLWDTITGERKGTLTGVGDFESFVVKGFDDFS
ncbi:MAG: hypothetical protein OXI67_15660, partial [Candidatus Poribacteria bacterium]|nr:hypothetical protein [Candidatus Poribacteria bacterium]